MSATSSEALATLMILTSLRFGMMSLRDMRALRAVIGMRNVEFDVAVHALVEHRVIQRRRHGNRIFYTFIERVENTPFAWSRARTIYDHVTDAANAVTPWLSTVQAEDPSMEDPSPPPPPRL